MSRRFYHTRSGRTLLITFLIAAVMLTACGEPDPSLTAGQRESESEPQGEILFVADHNVMRWDGGVEQVTHGVHASSPSWAPAGDRFAYVIVGEAHSDVIIVRSDGDPLVDVTEGHRPDLEEFSEEYVGAASWAWDVDWSPAGEQLIYVSDKSGVDQFSRPLHLWYSETFEVGPYLLNASAEIGVTQETPAFSPDGDTVAFVVRNDPGNASRVPEIWLLELNSATYEQFLVTDEGAYAPDWSPDGDHLAYIQRTGGANDVWIAPVNGDDPYQITDIGSLASPIWSPDGNFIAFFRESEGEFEVWYVTVDPGENGELSISEPEHLFNADNIDTVSGMSWIQR